MITFFYELYDQIYYFLTSSEFARLFLALRIASLLVSIFLIFLIIILLKRSDAFWWLRERRMANYAVYGSERMNKQWRRIMDRVARGDETNMKLAIIEADSIFDDLIKRMAFPGRDMDERLRQFEKQELKAIDQVWEAHKLRNEIVRDPNIQITKEQAEQAVKGYEEALKELEYLS